jgi:hypothetical protein
VAFSVEPSHSPSGADAKSLRSGLDKMAQSAAVEMEQMREAMRELASGGIRLPEPPRIDMSAHLDARVVDSLAEAAQATRQAQADLIVEPLRDALGQQHETLTAQHEALQKMAGALEAQTALMREQAGQLDEERSKRASAEQAEAAARSREGLKTTALVVLGFVTAVLTAVLIYIALNPSHS